ncbi:peroxisome membrane protein [Zychaea mexicana]|uniref:peroxisome membrane protein n=1 Tax=Zychaea mexicana TaxID=64656 RepID=UPI0022FF2AC1|nr:peroxisome membrane protein [Zychaea mexicana]KAI9488907.1 peroxisome membrane protein [Zychaea mexicana]
MDFFKQYDDFLLKNASQITGIEASLRSLTYILPGRFHDAEFASQALYAALNLLGLYHNAILRQAAHSHADETKSEHEESAFNKYINFWSTNSPMHKRCSALLSIISYTQVLMEMGVLKKWGKQAQWRWIAALEAVKVALRLSLFKLTSNRMNLYPHHLQRDVDPASLERNRRMASVPERYTGERSGVEMPLMRSTIEFDAKQSAAAAARRSNNNNSNVSVRKFGDVTDYLMSKVLTPEKLRRPDQMVHIMNAIGKSGEVLYILRPLLYVLAVLKYGRMSWKPWLLSLAVELLSQAMVRQAFEQPHGGRSKMMPLEKQEYARRLQLLWLNLLRGAFYMRITRPRLERFCNSVENKPVLSIAAGKG